MYICGSKETERWGKIQRTEFLLKKNIRKTTQRFVVKGIKEPLM